MKKPIASLVRWLQHYTDRTWYPPVLGLLALADAFLVVIPTDGLMISYVLMHPKRWRASFIWLSIGSAFGSLSLSILIRLKGLSILESIVPGITQMSAWTWTQNFMHEYGRLALWGISATPMFQHPAVALAALAHIPYLEIFLLVITARLAKYGFMAYVASHFPDKLSKLWGIQHEIKEVEQDLREASGSSPEK